ncbi:MAG: hypothetical protein ACJ765_02020 [Chloroflexota bacterium]
MDEAAAIEVGRHCPWCSTPARDEASTCVSCGAALAQRESIGDVAIPGVTTIEPSLLDADGRPHQLPGPSPTQGLASGVLAAAVIGGPVGLAALGGIAAVAAAEYVAGGRERMGSPESLDAVGRPSEVTLRALEQLQEAERGEAPDRPAPDASTAADAAPADGDPWRDLPPSA